MSRFHLPAALGFVVLALAACSPAPRPPASAAAVAPNTRLERIFERYWQAHVRLERGNPLAMRHLAEALALERDALAELHGVPRAALDEAAALSYDIFERGRELAIAGFTYPDELIPDPLHGMPQGMEPAGPGTGGYDDRNARIDDYAGWTEQAMANLRDGLRRGYALPREVVEHALPRLEQAARDTPQNAAYRKLHDFLAVEYLPQARAGVALGEFPLGDAWYAHRLKVHTDGARTAAQIHSLGLEEVERVRGRIREVLAANGLADDLPAVTLLLRREEPAQPDAAAVVRYQDLRSRVATGMPALFAAPPPEVGMSALERVTAAGAGGEAAYLHDAVPGRRYLLAAMAPSLPAFRRSGAAPAFVQGGALYAESLGEELGLYGDLKSKLAALAHDLQCSAALVVDTGMQTQHWTRRRALEYLRTHTAMGEAEADAELDRMITAPAEALAPKIGELEFLALRNRVLQTGARDLRGFHAFLLEGGPMPLDILDARIGRWIAAPP